MKYIVKTDIFYNIICWIAFAVLMCTITMYVVSLPIAWYIPFIVTMLSILAILYLWSDRTYCLHKEHRIFDRGPLLVTVNGACRYNGFVIDDCSLCVYQNHLILVDSDNVIYLDYDYHEKSLIADLTEDSLVVVSDNDVEADNLEFFADSIHLLILYKMLLRVGTNFDDEISGALIN